MELYEACTLLSDLTHISIVVLEDDEILKSFCNSHHFHSSQKTLTLNGFRNLIERLNDHNYISFRDTLRMHMMVFRLKGIPVVIGPFCVDDLSDNAVRLLIQRYNLKNFPIRDYQAYRSRYPTEREEKVIHAVRVLVAHVDPDTTGRSLEYINDELPRLPQSWEYSRKNFETLVDERYRIETEMMDCVRRGETRNAIDKYRYLHNNVRFMTRIGGTLETSRISAGIVRTTVRVAAMDTGLPPVLIDQLTGESTRIIGTCETREAMAKENERLIRVICEAVRRWRSEQYSITTFSALYYLERNFPDEITMEETASHLGISAAHFARTFKKDTGMTPNAYLLKLRIEHAAKLLRSTHYTIQHICSEVGIPDANYFVKCFRRHYGMTPSAYRLGGQKAKPEALE